MKNKHGLQLKWGTTVSVNIYPAYKDLHGAVCHADDWDEESTINVANGNFYWLIESMEIDHLIPEVPSTLKLKTFETALSNSPHTSYTDRLKKICAVARIKNVHLIAFS